jgi:hypothetical protein
MTSETKTMATDWNLLGAITERISQLTERADAAAAAGDLDLAAYLREQGKQADKDRQRTVDRLFGDVCETV